MPRMSRFDGVTLVPAWESPAHPAQLRDLSIAGIRVQTDIKVDREGVIRVMGPLFDVIARVVSCRGSGPRYELHGKLLRTAFHRTTGAVVSVKT